MKKRIISIVCAVVILATMLTVGIVSASADAGVILNEAISGELNSTMWTPSEKIIDGKLYPTVGDGATYAVTSVNSYNLGTDWTASIDFTTPTYFGPHAEPTRLVVGSVEAVAVNAEKDTTPLTEGYIALKVNGEEKGTRFSLGVGTNAWNQLTSSGGYAGTLTLSYKNGAIKVSFNSTEIITYDASADNLDFSAAAVTLSVKGNWRTDSDKFSINAFALNAANVGGSSSSTPASSTPESSTPESSTPDSSTPESSTPDSSTPDSSEPTSSAAPAGEKVVAEISGALVAEMWQESDKITDGVAIIPEGGAVTLNSVKKYDLGTEWETAASFTVTGWHDQMEHRPSSIKLGDVEIVSIDGKYDKTNKVFVEDGSIELKIKGETVQTSPVIYKGINGAPLALRATYKDGIIEVYYSLYGEEEAKVITYDATGDALNFSETPITLSSKGDWAKNTNKIKTFNLKTADTYVEPGAAIIVVKEATFNDVDWIGDTGSIDAEGKLLATGNSKRTITSTTAYDLSNGFKFAGKLNFKNGYTNYYGEHASMYIGEPKDGIEFRVTNIKDQGLYTGHLLIKGTEVATADLVNAPNGVYEITYKDGKLTVTLDGTAISWTLADKSTSTSVEIKDVELSKTTLGFHIEGNYHSTGRYWANYSLSPVSASDGAPNTGDARNITVAVVAVVLGACAVAFVATRKKANA